MNNFSRFHGKNILITGSTGGIGQAVAKRFVQEGGHVLLVDQEFDRLNAQTISLGKNASSFVCDVTNEVQCKHVNADILHHHSRIDIAILNAGIEGPIADLDTLTTADFDQVMAVNARGVFIWLSMLMKTMKKQSHGVITLTSSVAGLKGTAGLSPYVASKHAMMGLMKCAALEGAAHGIRVNAVNPGPIDTRMIQSIEAGFGDPNLVRQKYLSSIPLKRYGLADEIASTVAFLSSDEAGYSTGSGFVIDGGGQAGRSRWSGVMNQWKPAQFSAWGLGSVAAPLDQRCLGEPGICGMSTTRKVTEEIAQTLGSSMHMLLSVTTPRKVCSLSEGIELPLWFFRRWRGPASW